MKTVKADEVESVLRRYLDYLGFILSPEKSKGQTGPDLIATKGNKRLVFEIIGFQEHPPIRSREFYECFFRIISRDRNSLNDQLIMALPIRFARGMSRRKEQYGIAWKKIGRAFPNLKIWFIDTTMRNIWKRNWNSCDILPKEEESLRGLVMQKWLESACSRWSMEKTIDVGMGGDRDLMLRGLNPAKAFRDAAEKGNQSYIIQWVHGCRFPWLALRK